VVLFQFLKRAKLGQAMRAVAEDPVAAALQGIDAKLDEQPRFCNRLRSGRCGRRLLLPLSYVTLLSAVPWC